MLGTSKTRKTDVDDAQWLVTLARAGLLSGKSERKTLERACRYWARNRNAVFKPSEHANREKKLGKLADVEYRELSASIAILV
jgi:hypothetical protein